MYHIAVSFDVPPEHHQTFIAAALEDGRDSGRYEPGTRRFELIQDQENPNRFYLDETYVDQAAFDKHANGPYFKKFFEAIGSFAKGPTWLIRGTRIEDRAAAERSASAQVRQR
jgi:autoinducer 2-degrading protein